jgi:hypothetical protein
MTLRSSGIPDGSKPTRNGSFIYGNNPTNLFTSATYDCKGK